MNFLEVIRVFAPLMWLIALSLFIFRPQWGLLFIFAVKASLYTVQSKIGPVAQIGDIAILYSDGFIAVLVLFFCFTQVKSLLTAYSHYKVRITPFTLLLGWVGLQTLRGIVLNGASSIRQAEIYLFPILYCFILPKVLKEKTQVKRFVLVALKIVISAIILNLMYFYLLGGMNYHLTSAGATGWRARFRFIGSQQVMLAGIGFNALLVFFLSHESKPKLRFYIVLIMLALAIFLPQFRSAWLAIAVGTSMIVLRVKNLPKVWLYAVLGFFLLLGFIPLFSLLAGQQFSDVLAQSTQDILNGSFQEDSTWQFRLMVWKENWTANKEHLLMGRGLGEHIYVLVRGEQHATIMHNDYLAYINYFGLIGLSLLGLSIWYWFVNTRNYTHLEADRFYKWLGLIMRISIVMYMIFAAFFSFGEWFWLCISLGLTLVDIRKRKITSPYQEQRMHSDPQVLQLSHIKEVLN